MHKAEHKNRQVMRGDLLLRMDALLAELNRFGEMPGHLTRMQREKIRVFCMRFGGLIDEMMDIPPG